MVQFRFTDHFTASMTIFTTGSQFVTSLHHPPYWCMIQRRCMDASVFKFSNFSLDVFSNTQTFPAMFSALSGVTQRLRWSRGYVLASSTQVRGFKSGRSRRIFQGEKIPSTPSFGGEVKPAVTYRRFTACKRSPNVTWNSAFRQNSRLLFMAH
jgi:hypothetical protein